MKCKIIKPKNEDCLFVSLEYEDETQSVMWAIEEDELLPIRDTIDKYITRGFHGKENK
jgi:hypothetical protein